MLSTLPAAHPARALDRAAIWTIATFWTIATWNDATARTAEQVATQLDATAARLDGAL